MKWAVFASMEQKSLAQIRLLPTWFCTAGLGAHGEKEIYSATAQSDEYGDQRESLSTLPRCGSFPKPEMSTASCLLLFGESKLREWPAGTISIAVAGLCQSADLSKDFSHVHHSVGGSLLAGKGQAPRGNIKLSMVTWMRLGKANQADAQWSWALFKLRQFIPNAWRKNVNEDRSNMFGYSWYRKLPHTSDLSWSIHYLFNNWFQFLTNKEVQ